MKNSDKKSQTSEKMWQISEKKSQKVTNTVFICSCAMIEVFQFFLKNEKIKKELSNLAF